MTFDTFMDALVVVVSGFFIGLLVCHASWCEWYALELKRRLETEQLARVNATKDDKS